MLGAASGRTLVTRIELGRCLAARGRMPEAEEHLRAAWRAGKDERRVVRPALESLVALYEKWGRREEARRCREALAETSPPPSGRGPG